MSKKKKGFSISSDGILERRGICQTEHIQATSKSAALRELLLFAKRALEEPPVLKVNAGAIQLS